MKKNKSIWAFILLSVCLSIVLPSVGFAQDEDSLTYIEPTVPPDFPKPGDPAIAEETVNGITVKIMDVKLSIESRELWSETEKKIECGRDTCREVGAAGPRGRKTHADLTGRAGVAVGGMGCPLLMAHEVVFDLGCLVEDVVDVQDRAARVAEDDVNPLLLEALDEYLRARELHVPPPFVSMPCKAQALP